MSDLQRHNNTVYEEDEISLKDIIDFLIENWKTILAAGILGLAASLIFVFVAPAQYEAKAQIKMAQIRVINNNNNNVNSLGVNIEEPAVLMARVKLPTSFDPVTIDRCGLTGEKDAQDILAKLVKLSEVKGAPSVVDLSIQSSTKEQADACVSAIFDLIKSSQKAIKEPFVIEAKSKLAEYQKRLDDSRSVILRADKSGAALSAAYLATRDEVKNIMDEVMRLQDFITSGDTRITQLTAPIYAIDHPVFPKKKISVIVGFMAGLFLGLLFVMVRQAYRKMYLNQN
jgi:capsular polysaccharide biosynthesis protein